MQFKRISCNDAFFNKCRERKQWDKPYRFQFFGVLDPYAFMEKNVIKKNRISATHDC